MKKIYFNNLNGLRFIAAFAVIIHHIEQYKSTFGYKNIWKLNIISNLGNIGVQFFFVLSGFLITYLLLKEENEGGINYRNFIFRRIYRIWPLYFIIIILSFFIAPLFNILHTPSTPTIFENFYLKLFCVCLFIPNIIFKVTNAVPLASQSWSIGVEEQFYIIWPLIIKKIKNPQIYFLGIIILYLILKVLFFKLSIACNDLKTISGIVNDFSLSGFVLGAIGAYFSYKKKENILKFITNNSVFRLSLILFLVLIIYSNSETFYYIGVISIENEIYCFLFIIFIVNFIDKKNLKLSLENRTLNYLGKISYGLYMYHPICITLILNIIKSEINLLIIYPLTFLLTILVSSFSYKYIEKPFLKLKKY
tara:strand:+ start:3097 stop:4188 length:1092 start_codon:yes stop_codon:yes gene_type:complete